MVTKIINLAAVSAGVGEEERRSDGWVRQRALRGARRVRKEVAKVLESSIWSEGKHTGRIRRRGVVGCFRSSKQGNSRSASRVLKRTRRRGHGRPRCAVTRPASSCVTARTRARRCTPCGRAGSEPVILIGSL